MSYINAPRKLLAHLDRVAELRAIQRTPAPVNVEIDLSNRCNLGCAWCHMAHTHTRGPLASQRRVETGDLMDTALAGRLMPELAQAGVRSVVWSGGGEPTLHPDFDALVNACLLPQGLYTNGTTLTQERAGRLKQVMQWVYVSLDAATAEAYRAVKGVDQFQAVCEGIRRLVKALGGATVGIGFLLNRQNWMDAPAMRRLGESLGAHYVQFRPAVLFDQEHRGLAQDVDWIDQARPLLATLQGEGVEMDLDRFDRLRHWQGHGYTQCSWCTLQTVITPDGRLWTCVNKRGDASALLGDLKAESFAAIWATHTVRPVDTECRVMCRGHLPNLALQPLITRGEHEEFI